MKKIVSVSMAKNESDIIESFCRYTLTFCDQMLIYEDYSTDNTLEILEKLVDEGLNIIVMDKEPFKEILGFNQGTITNLLAKSAVNKLGADLVLPIDCDEFLFANDEDCINPREALEKLDENTEYRIDRLTYLYQNRQYDDNTLFMPKYFSHCGGFSEIDYVPEACKVIVSKNLVLDKRYMICHGNHLLLDIINDTQNKNFHKSDELYYAHYPMRSIPQAISKSVIGWTNQIVFDKDMSVAIHWKEMFEKFKREGFFGDADLQQFTVDYMYGAAIEDGCVKLINAPVFNDCDIPLKYTDYCEIEKNCFFNIIDNFEKTIIKLSKLVTEKNKQ